jgi:hypothetical protein
MRMQLPDGGAARQAVHNLRRLVKKEILDMLVALDTLKMWVQLEIPQAEEHNFGCVCCGIAAEWPSMSRVRMRAACRVEVAEEIVELLSSGRLAGVTVLEASAKYFLTRAHLVTKAREPRWCRPPVQETRVNALLPRARWPSTQL